MGSGNLPPSFLYSSRIFKKICATMPWSSLQSPGIGKAVFFQSSQRAELVNEPSFSANPAQGKRYTVVRICFISSCVMPGDFQNSLDEMKQIQTTVYRLPCAGFAEKDGSFTNS